MKLGKQYTAGLLRAAANEVDQLHRENKTMHAELRIVRIFEMALQPRYGGGAWAGTSLADDLRRHADNLESIDRGESGEPGPAIKGDPDHGPLQDEETEALERDVIRATYTLQPDPGAPSAPGGCVGDDD